MDVGFRKGHIESLQAESGAGREIGRAVADDAGAAG